MDDPFFPELAGIAPNNSLYRAWIDYASTLTRSDILAIVRGGLTHQANSLKAMLKEAVAGQRVKPSLYQKLNLLTTATAKHAAILRQS